MTKIALEETTLDRAGRHASRSDGAVLESTASGVDVQVQAIASATPMQLVDIERHGVPGVLVKELARRLDIPASRLYAILGVPKATAEKKAVAGDRLHGSAGQAAVGVMRLLAIAQAMVADSTSDEAKAFDAARWLGHWLEKPQPALGGRRPAELVDTPTGVDIVARLLGSLESDAYQ